MRRKGEGMPHIRILPHSQAEFPSRDALTIWLLTALKARAGRYLLRSPLAELSAGSIVLFRVRNEVVGEAVVREYVRDGEPITDTTLAGQEQRYEAHIDFAPGSIRLFVPPISIETLQQLIGDDPDITVAQGSKIIRDWSLYPKILAKHVATGGGFQQ
jgi:hypothetical protein